MYTILKTVIVGVTKKQLFLLDSVSYLVFEFAFLKWNTMEITGLPSDNVLIGRLTTLFNPVQSMLLLVTVVHFFKFQAVLEHLHSSSFSWCSPASTFLNNQQWDPAFFSTKLLYSVVKWLTNSWLVLSIM